MIVRDGLGAANLMSDYLVECSLSHMQLSKTNRTTLGRSMRRLNLGSHPWRLPPIKTFGLQGPPGVSSAMALGRGLNAAWELPRALFALVTVTYRGVHPRRSVECIEQRKG
jgi:hypothetical protein